MKFPDGSQQSSAAFVMLSVTHIMPDNVLSTVGVEMQQCMIRNHIFNIYLGLIRFCLPLRKLTIKCCSVDRIEFTDKDTAENLEMSGNLTAVKEMSGNLLKIREMSWKNLVTEKLPKSIYCKLHICVHTGI